MRIKVTGPSGGKIDDLLEDYVKAAVVFFSKKLKIDHIKSLIHIKIHKKTYYDQADAQIVYNGKRSIVIDVCLYNDWLTSLAHEMVHVRQFYNGEINHKMMLKDINNHDEYRNAFYEKEAFALQRELVEAFTEYQYESH